MMKRWLPFRDILASLFEIMQALKGDADDTLIAVLEEMEWMTLMCSLKELAGLLDVLFDIVRNSMCCSLARKRWYVRMAAGDLARWCYWSADAWSADRVQTYIQACAAHGVQFRGDALKKLLVPLSLFGGKPVLIRAGTHIELESDMDADERRQCAALLPPTTDGTITEYVPNTAEHALCAIYPVRCARRWCDDCGS